MALDITIDRELCMGSGNCSFWAPGVFDLDDDGIAVVLDAARVGDGPVCTLRLPERISSGTHSTWAAGAELRRWQTADTAADAVGL